MEYQRRQVEACSGTSLNDRHISPAYGSGEMEIISQKLRWRTLLSVAV
jgi:hypothetical protein